VVRALYGYLVGEIGAGEVGRFSVFAEAAKKGDPDHCFAFLREIVKLIPPAFLGEPWVCENEECRGADGVFVSYEDLKGDVLKWDGHDDKPACDECGSNLIPE
jgi:hypothetical protein